MRPILLITSMIALTLTACNRENDLPKDDWQVNVPGLMNGVDPESGEKITTYMGHEIPLAGDARQRMMEVLNLISTQQGDIDDQLFVSMLTSSPLSTINLFKADVVEQTKLRWYGRYEIPGISLGGTIQANDNGTLTSISGPNCNETDVMHHMDLLGIKGFYATYYWEYNADSNILISSHTESGKKMTAELLYFDGSEAVMLGKIAGISNTGIALDSNGREVTTEYELHYLKFEDGGRLSLEGYEQGYIYEYLRLVCDVEMQMESIMHNHGDYDVEALAQEFNNSKWRECGVLRYYDETMRHVEDVDAWDGEWYIEGCDFTDYTLSIDGTGYTYNEPMVDPFEPVTVNIQWTFDQATRQLVISNDDNGNTTTAKVSAYFELSDDSKFMVWDIDDNSHIRIVLTKVE